MNTIGWRYIKTTMEIKREKNLISCKKFKYIMILSQCDTHNLSTIQFYQIDGLVIRYYDIPEISDA